VLILATARNLGYCPYCLRFHVSASIYVGAIRDILFTSNEYRIWKSDIDFTLVRRSVTTSDNSK